MGHEENKSLAPGGQSCEADPTGLLQRRPVTARSISHIGKEANQRNSTTTGTSRCPSSGS